MFAGHRCEYTAGGTRLLLNYHEQYITQGGPMKELTTKGNVLRNSKQVEGNSLSSENCRALKHTLCGNNEAKNSSAVQQTKQLSNTNAF